MKATSIMDGSNSTVVEKCGALGVSKIEHSYADEYVGTAETLIAAGIVRADQLPGRPGMAKYMATFYAGELVPLRKRAPRRDENWMRVHKMGKKFSVLLGLPVEVEAARDAARDAKMVTERKAQQKIKDQQFLEKVQAQLKLNLMVNSAGEYRQKMINKLQGEVRDLCRQDVLPNENHGFSLGDSVAAQIEDLLAEMIDVISSTDVQFEPRRHREINQQCRSILAKSDSAFQRTLEGMIHGTK